MKLYVLYIPAMFIAFDILTGWLKALSTGTVNSSIMRKGLTHKLGEILALAFGAMCEYAFPVLGIESNVPFTLAICVYLIVMETASIIENLAAMNPQLAGILNRLFSKEKLNGDNKDEN